MSHNVVSVGPRGRRQDLFASLVVFFIALPLSMGIAMASGAPVSAGLIAAAAGGIVVSVLGGTPLGVSGPSAASAVLIFELAQQYGFDAVTAAIVGAGVLQVAFAFSRLGRFATAIAPPVVEGMLAGMGALIVVSQSTVVLGSKPLRSAWQNIASLPGLSQTVPVASLALAALTALILLGWPKMHARLSQAVPASVVGIGVPSLVAYLTHADVARVTLPENLWSLGAPDMGSMSMTTFACAAVTIALIASTESLLSALALDKLTPGSRTDLDKELRGQGIANIVSGLLGGLPVHGVIIRSSANLQAGAKSPLSAFMHGVWIVLIATFAQGALSHVPLATLATLLVITGIRLINVRTAHRMWNHGELATYLITFVGVVSINLLTGVALGLSFSVLRLFGRMSRARIHVSESIDNTINVSVEGAATFLLVPQLLAILHGIPPEVHVNLHLPAGVVDFTVQEAVVSWRQQHESRRSALVVNPAQAEVAS